LATERREAWRVEASEEGLRLDVAVSSHLPDVSRAQARRWIAEERVLLDGERARPSRPCRRGQRIEVEIPLPLPAEPRPEAIPLDVLYEDSELIVVNKPPGMVVHPSPGHPSGTLVNALLAHAKDLSGVGGVARPGIVHRLDSGTSGVLVVAKSDRAHRALAAQFQRRSVEKRYLAVVLGSPPARLAIDRAIGRDPVHRTKISSRSSRGREARTEIALEEALPLSSLVAVRIHTGRTHQIRVHLSEAGHPVVGDRAYGAPGPKAQLPRRGAAAFRLLRDFPRPALHALELSLRHPAEDRPMRWRAPLPPDLTELLRKLRALRAGGAEKKDAQAHQ
jgi:23S rRNA pseudouridine1911/1915/1917 synthase